MKIEREPLTESRRRYATIDSDIRIERMMTEIALGGTKQTSLVVNGPSDEALWDRLVEDIVKIPVGGIMDYGLRELD